MRYLSDSVVSTAYRVSRKLVKVKCDICGKELIAKDKSWNDYSSRYYEVTTGHHDWGNDSVDSVKTKDVCPDCLIDYVKVFFGKHKESSTAYCEISSASSYPETESRVVDKLPDEKVLIKEDHDLW